MFKKVVLGTVLFFASVVVAFFLLIKVIDFNEYKPRIQKTIKDVLGYEVAIKGDITLSLSPVGVRIFDVEIKNPYHKPHEAFAKVGAFDIAVEIAPLLKKEIKVKHIAFEKLNLNIEKSKEGHYNFEKLADISNKKQKETNATKQADKEEYFSLININKVKFSEATVLFNNAQTNNKVSAEKLNLFLDNISLDSTKSSKLQGLSFKADISIEKLLFNHYTFANVSTNVQMKDALISMEELQYTLFDSLFQGSGKLDISGQVPRISVKQKVQELKLAKISEHFFGKAVFEGNANAEVKLASLLADKNTTRSTLGGFIAIQGENIHLQGYDLDALAAKINEQDTFDPSAIEQLLLKPSQDANKTSTRLKQLVIKTDIGYSEVKLSDVAMSTDKYRMAIKGAINIVEERFLDVKMAFIDDGGCATFEQTITGKFQKPKLKLDESIINSVARSALSLFGKSKKEQEELVIRPEEPCVPFYQGEVKSPKNP